MKGSRSGRGSGDAEDDGVVGRAYDSRLIRKLWPFVRPVRGVVAGTLLVSIATSLAQIAQPYLLKLGIDDHIARGDARGLAGVAAFYALALLVQLVGSGAVLYLSNLAGQHVTRALRSAVYRHTLERPIAFFEKHPAGRLLTRITSDPESINELFASGAVSVVTDVVKMAAIVAVMLWLDVRLTLVSFLMVPLLLAMSAYLRVRVRDAYRKVRTSVARLNAYLQEGLTGMVIVRIFGQEARSEREFNEHSRRYLDDEMAGVVYESAFSAVVELIGTLAVALLLWFGGGRVVASACTFGTLVAFLDYTQRFYAPLRELSAKYTVMQAAMAAAEKIWDVLDDTARIPEPDAPGAFPATWDAVRVENVTFRYAADREPALRNVSLQIRQGEKVALVGATGSGKSTLAKLLVRFYDPEGGRITVGGTDLRALATRDVRRNLTLLLQDSYLFSGDVRTNLTLEDDRATDATLAAALSASRFDAVVARLPGGLSARLAERGINLSAGERQLLGLARALALAPPVLILDEATASVDPAEEERIREALHKVLEGRTALVIAHRLSTIREVDRILVMHHGEVREEGTHEQLLARDGLYARLYRLQLARVAAVV